MAVVNKSVDEILVLEKKKKTARTFQDWLEAHSRAELLKEEFMADLNAFYRIAQTGEVAFS
jgi:hypothetical protein